MALMDKKPYDKITISDITEKAGIVRQTFYRNYDEKDDVLYEYARNTMNANFLSIEKNQDSKKQDSIVLTFNVNYILKHQKELKKILSVVNIENRILRAMQEFPLSLIKHFKDKLSKEEYAICRYKICYQITGCLRVFLDWFLNDMSLPIDTFVSMINAMTIPHETFYRNIPNIVVRINKG
jgi:AcrR family transcriptional regulator